MSLPELPELLAPTHCEQGFSYGYTADQMRAYGAACAKAERERCAAACEALAAFTQKKRPDRDCSVPVEAMLGCASIIRSLPDAALSVDTRAPGVVK